MRFFNISTDAHLAAQRYDLANANTFRIVANAWGDYGTRMESALKNRTPVKTGDLRGSTTSTNQMEKGNRVIRIFQPARTPDGKYYGVFVRQGTKPHVIEARPGWKILITRLS